MKTQNEVFNLIKHIESFINETIDKADINKGQGRVDWKQDATKSFHLENSLQSAIDKLNIAHLENYLSKGETK